MASVVQSSQAFLPGHELWILPDEVPKAFSSQIDWYLNFQLSKSARHERHKRSPELEHLLTATEQSFPPQELDPTQLVVSASNLLPCRWVAKTRLSEADLEKWTQDIQAIWSSLGKPKTKIFLPENQDPKLVMKSWNQNDPVQDYVVVHFGVL